MCSLIFLTSKVKAKQDFMKKEKEFICFTYKYYHYKQKLRTR